ncbi:MAG: hypothetical protein AAFW73_23345 [Bacteroidota bacterium]
MTKRTVEIIRRMSTSRHQAFRAYLESPFFTTNKKLLRVLETKNKKLESWEAYARFIFPGKPFNKQVLKNLCSQFNKHYRKFLAFQFLRDREDLVEVFAEGQIIEDGDAEVFKLRLKGGEGRDPLQEDIFSTKFLNAFVYEEFPKVLDRQEQVAYSRKWLRQKFRLSKKSSYLIELTFLCSYCHLRQRAILKTEYPEFERRIQQLPSERSVIIELGLEIYYASLMLVIQPELEQYQQLRRLYDEHTALLHVDHLSFIASILINYVSGQINRGAELWYHELFEIYDFLLRKKVRNHYRDTTVLNYVKSGCWAGEMQTVEAFLLSHHAKIGANTLAYSRALIAHFQGDYRGSQQLLLGAEYTSIWYQFSSRALSIRNLILLDEGDVALSNIESLRIFLLRNKGFGKELLKVTLGHLKYLKLIVLYLWNKDSMVTEARECGRLELVERIREAPQVINKRFLLLLLANP